jgi:RNA polymerase sigma factor (sigma-70 family)
MTGFERLQRDSTDREALAAWYQEVYPSIFVYAFRITHGNRSLAEDLCHEVLFTFLSEGHIKKIVEPKSAVFYIRSMISRAFRDGLRKERRRATNRPTLEISGSDSPEISVAANDVYEQLVNQISAEDYEILGMMFSGESLSHIAAELGISYSNAGVRVHRIRQQINELLNSAQLS